MKKNNWLLPGLVAFLIVAGSLAVGFSSRASEQKQKDINSTCCQKIKECGSKESGSGETILDNPSRQFMVILPF